MTEDLLQQSSMDEEGEAKSSPSDSHAQEATGSNPRVIVGLGNPGEKYLNTRHNVGFRVVEELARRHGASEAEEVCRSEVYKTSTGDIEAWWVAPQTFMNRSGFAVRCLQERHDLDVDDFLIVYDEVHLTLGTLRLRTKGSPGGHRGMESIAENLGTDHIARLRLGVGGEEKLEGADLVDFVLGEPTEQEQDLVEAMISRAADACEAWCQTGPEPAMQKFNGPPTGD